jgi:sec-independent protein translocase protein TatA
MMGLRAPEIILIILAIVLLFGASKLPQLAKSIGASKRAFKEGLAEAEEDDSSSAAPAQIRKSSVSDDELAAELARRRAAAQASK